MAGRWRRCLGERGGAFLLGAVVAVAVIAAVIGGEAALSSTAFCTSCHSMSYPAAELKKSTHYGALGADRAVLALATQGAADEIRHADLCVRLASRYAGHDVEPDPVAPVELPSHPGTEPRLRMQLHAAGLAISETLAAAFLERCLSEAEREPNASPTVLTVLRDHLSDDVSHARVGFAHLASRAVSDAERAAIAALLPRLLGANLRHWRRRIVELPVVPAHGYPAHAALLQSVEVAAREVLVPGFAHVGIRAG